MLAVTLVSALTFAVPQGPGPQVPAAPSPVPSADSQRIVRRARSEQAAFELFRRARLPIGYRSSDPCEVRIGRYCYWRGDEDDDKPPPPEVPAIRQRREQLLHVLDSSTTVLKGDTWLTGQTVRYLVETDSIDAALRTARDKCEASASWCHALAGYAAHRGGRFATADSEFATALASMDSSQQCQWLDISKLITDELSARYEKLDCPGRVALARHALRIGSPLYSVSESDLLTEHLTRVTRGRIAERSVAPDGWAWADDVNELMVRYGWPRWYSRTVPSIGSQEAPSIIGHDAGMPYNFLPSLTALEHPGEVAQKDWQLDDPRAVTGYAPSYLRTIHDVPNQIARFRRGDTTLIVAAWDARRDTTLIGRPLDAALVIWENDSTRAITRRTAARDTGTIATTAVVDAGLVSLELLAVADRRAARVRIGIPPRDTTTVALSDLLLYIPSEESANSLDAVRGRALASTIIPASHEIGAFWEAYGLGVLNDPVHFTLTIEPVEVGWMRRVAEALRFADPTRALRIQWEEVPLRTDGIAGRGVRVGVAQLRAGKYRMQLLVEAPGGKAATTTREIEVR